MTTANTNIRTYPVDQLSIGLYVEKLDRPMADLPFPVQGFHITMQEEINFLRQHCKTVQVNILKSRKEINTTHLSLMPMDTPQNNTSRSAVKQPAKATTHTKNKNTKKLRSRFSILSNLMNSACFALGSLVLLQQFSGYFGL